MRVIGCGYRKCGICGDVGNEVVCVDMRVYEYASMRVIGNVGCVGT